MLKILLGIMYLHITLQYRSLLSSITCFNCHFPDLAHFCANDAVSIFLHNTDIHLPDHSELESRIPQYEP